MSAKKTKLIVAEVRQIAFSICSDVARKILIEAAERLEETDKIAEFYRRRAIRNERRKVD